MPRIAVIEDDPTTSAQLAGWIRAARPELIVDQHFDRDAAEAALLRERYDLVVLDIELGRERNAGVALINEINKQGLGTPVLVVSAMPAAIYRSIMKALDAWDYLQKTTFDEAEFIETFLDILRTARLKEPAAKPAAKADESLQLDPLKQRTPSPYKSPVAVWLAPRKNVHSVLFGRPVTVNTIVFGLTPPNEVS